MREVLARRRPRWGPALWWILGLGLLLRLALMAFFTPTIFNYYGGDSTRYLRLDFVGVDGIFGDVAMPAGYPAFLAALRALWAWLPLTIMVQHLLGLAAAALLYAAVVRLGASRWAALLPAGVVALSGDQLFLEHGIFTEALWTPAIALGLYLVARAVGDGDRRDRWLAAGGVVLACSALVRHVSQVLPVLVAAWAVIALPGTSRQRVRHAAAVLLPALAVIGVYFAIAKPIARGYSGLTENRGFSLYGRVAQFADCRRFTPPAGTRPLCVDTPPEERPGPFFWTFGAESPIRTRLQFDIYDPEHQALLSRFARAAILHQPLDYVRTVTKDILRFFAPGLGAPRASSGTDAGSMSFESVVPAAQGVSMEQLARQFGQVYRGVGSGVASEAARTAFGAYQEVFRVDGLLTLLLIAFGTAGWALGRGALRAGAALFLLAGLVLLVFPPLFSSYDVRYAVPPINLFAAAAALGLTALAARLGAGSGDRDPLPRTAARHGPERTPLDYTPHA